MRNLQYTSTVHSKPTGCDPDERALTILRQNEEMSHAKAAASWGSGLQKPSGGGGQHDDRMPREVKRLAHRKRESHQQDCPRPARQTSALLKI